ncbi:MAG: substrate-binding domain-containing protein [Chloroflexota bacterium]|nr:substrate-binding domain-containing protein [Chloroflexota bacterium]
MTPTASSAPAASTLPDASAATASAATASAAPATVPPRSAEPSIGYISLDGSQAFVQAVSLGIRESATAAGIDLVECDSGWSRKGVRACAEQLAQAGVHGVISFQPFADLAAEVCTTTGDAPTIGIVYDQGPCQVSMLQIDQAESGRMAGAAMGQLAALRWGCDVKAYISLESDDGDSIGAERMQGYRDGYQEHCELPEETRTLIGAQHLVTAKTQVAAALEKLKGRPILVAGVSDIAILGAMEAAADAGREDHLWYSGQLADSDIRAEIACNDRYIASVAQLPERFGTALVPTLVDAIEGRDVVPRIDAELQLVTAENVRQLFPDTPACDE